MDTRKEEQNILIHTHFYHAQFRIVVSSEFSIQKYTMRYLLRRSARWKTIPINEFALSCPLIIFYTLIFYIEPLLCNCFMGSIFVIDVSFERHLWIINALINLRKKVSACFHWKISKLFHSCRNHESYVVFDNQSLKRLE